MFFVFIIKFDFMKLNKILDEIGCLMSNDLSHALFDCWVKAAILEYIPSLSYWRTLSVLSWKWIPHVIFMFFLFILYFLII